MLASLGSEREPWLTPLQGDRSRWSGGGGTAPSSSAPPPRRPSISCAIETAAHRPGRPWWRAQGDGPQTAQRRSGTQSAASTSQACGCRFRSQSGGSNSGSASWGSGPSHQAVKALHRRTHASFAAVLDACFKNPITSNDQAMTSPSPAPLWVSLRTSSCHGSSPVAPA